LPKKKAELLISSGIETMQKSKIHYTKESVNIEQEYEAVLKENLAGIQMDIPEENGDDHILMQ
jgi:hypothetical protein